MLNWKLFLSLLVLLGIAAAAGADDPKEGKALQAGAKHPGLERLKKLAGEWREAGADGKPTDKLVSVFRLTAAGSAVHETIFPGTPHEMVTLYHLDGADLVLTHYCAAGNQPRMKADPKSPPNQLRFQFAGGSNLDPKKDMHMHEGSITFVDDDHIEWTWIGYQDGKPADGHKVSLKLVRKKPLPVEGLITWPDGTVARELEGGSVEFESNGTVAAKATLGADGVFALDKALTPGITYRVRVTPPPGKPSVLDPMFASYDTSRLTFTATSEPQRVTYKVKRRGR